MADSPDYILDVSGIPVSSRSDHPQPSQPTDPRGDASMVGRPWLAMYWRCCEVYSRVYRNRTATAYDGCCPRCGKHVCVRIGAGGTPQRFFEAF